MAQNNTLIAAARKVLHSEPRIGPHFNPHLAYDTDGTLTVEGEVETVAA